MNKEDKERLVKLLGQNKLTRAGSFALHTYIRNLEDCNKEKDKEIERLNNIIDELEKYLEQQWLEWKDDSNDEIVAMAKEDKTILDKLKELKGSDK